ncbi:hypothetical protein G9A89_019302 [Geosiphon pyriformis]|nr:hypothetical protein G9A89_019302 [Geosiphon pyriformis]
MIIIVTNYFVHQVTGLLFTQHPKESPVTFGALLAESEIIGANHLGFTKFLFQKYSQQLGLNNNHYPAKSAFNYYVNDKITDYLGETINIESARENFYTELFQHTSLPRNHSFIPIIREINQTIERYVQQQFPITYTDKDKGRLQIPAVMPKGIQLPIWKKQRIESPPYSSYYHTSGSTINITSAGTFTPNATSTFGQFLFQSKQKKVELLGPYEIMESEEEEEKKTEDQKFTYQNPITEDPEFEIPNLQNQQNLNSVNSEVETPNIQTPPTQDNRNPDPINQPNLPPVIPPQPPNLDPIVYAPIVKLDNFTSKEDNAQVWLNDSLINKPQDFNAFKVEFLKYFNNNNSINHLVNTFTTMKQGETEAVTTYLRCFYRNLHQIQAINANYFTAPQILNQFIRDAVTHVRDFESAKSEANHAQAVNLVINRSSELDSKLKQFSDSINQKLEGYLADNPIQETTIISKIKHISQYQPISSGSQRHVSATTVISTKSGTISKHLLANDATANLSSTSISDSSLSTAATSNISTTATCNILTTATSNLSTSINSDTAPKFNLEAHKTRDWQWLSTNQSPVLLTHYQDCILGIQNYLSLLVTPENATTNNLGPSQQQALTNNILLTTVTNNELLMAIFLFNLEEMIKIPLFSGTALEEKPITAMYTDAKINDHAIKLILDSGSAGSIITRQLMDQLGRQVDQAASAKIITANGATKTPIDEIDNLLIEINGIMVSIKVLVIEATQYQALVGNNWLSKTHTTLDWTTQELQLTFGGPYTQTPATFLWTDEGHNELPPILFWDNKGKGKENKELTWKTDQNWETDNNQDKPANWEWKETDKERERRKKKEPLSPTAYIVQMRTLYHHQPIIVDQNWNASIATRNCYQWAHAMATTRNTPQPQDFTAAHWDNQPCLACGTILPDERIWNDIPGYGGMCNETCQYSHDKDKLWRIVYAKAEDTTTSKLLEIKNNPLLLPEPEYVQTFNVFGNIEDNPKEFHKHYQHLAPTKEEQEQRLEQLNT